mgnify:CR=1 FL=1
MTEEQKALKEIEKRISKENRSTNAIRFLKENTSKLFILVIVVVYVLYGTLVLIPTGASIEEILGNVSISLLTGSSIYFFMRNAGSQDAKKSDYFLNIKTEYEETKKKICDKIDSLPSYCNMKNAFALENKKKSLIQSVNLSYRIWKTGFYDEEVNRIHLSVKQKVALMKVNEIKIKPIQAMDLLNESNLTKKEYERHGEFGKSEREYNRNKTITGLFGMLLFSTVFGYYTVFPTFNEGTLQSIMWNLFQVVLWIGIGTLKYFDSKSFILYEYCENNIRKKTAYLNEFIAITNNSPEVLIQYSDATDDEVEKYIQQKEGQKNGNEPEKEKS